jgi:hyperosmotically inducible protein
VIFIVAAMSTFSCATAEPPVGRIDLSLEDARLSAAVRTAILNDPELGLRRIAVDAHDGVVTLDGTVPSGAEARRAVAVARAVAGVREVTSSLRADADAR